MITKEKARQITIKYLSNRGRNYVLVLPVEKIQFIKNKKVLYGKRAGENVDTYIVCYTIDWGLDYQSMFVSIDAKTGEPLYTMGPASWIEELEDN